MARSNTTEGQALWQPGGAEEDSHFREGDSHLRLTYDDDDEEEDTFTRRNEAQSESCGQGHSCGDLNTHISIYRLSPFRFKPTRDSTKSEE